MEQIRPERSRDESLVKRARAKSKSCVNNVGCPASTTAASRFRPLQTPDDVSIAEISLDYSVVGASILSEQLTGV